MTVTGSVFLPDSDPVLDVREYRQAGTGIRYYFDVRHYNQPGPPRQLQYYAGRVEYPNGEIITYTYNSGNFSCPVQPCPPVVYKRPARIASNMGYHIRLTYPVEYMDEGETAWSTPSTATLYRTGVTEQDDVALRRLTYGGGQVTDSGSTIDDPSDDRTYTCSGCGGTLSVRIEQTGGTLQLPDELAPALQATKQSLQLGLSQPVDVVHTVVRDGVTWTYTFQNPHVPPGSSSLLYDSVTVTGPNGFHRIYNMVARGFSITAQFNVLGGVVAVTGIAGAPNPTTSYEIDTVSARPTRATYPEGNAVSVEYDDAGNLTRRIAHARPGSGTAPATITEEAHYPLPGLPQFCTIACWRPDWSEDGEGRRTDYRYNAAGQLTEQSEPADAGGARRRTLIEYQLSPNGHLSRRLRATICAVTSPAGQGLSTCDLDRRLITEYEYVGDTLLVSLERRRDPATSAVLETRHSYDVQGRLTSTDGPLPGTGDAIHYRYDAFGRRTWEIGPADANGLRQATRSFYRASDDKVVRVETGNVTSPTATAFATHLNRADIAYDARRNPVRETASTPTAAGTWDVQTLLQRSFDDRGQLVCEARRMNRALFATLPDANICLPTAPGADGPDRIARNLYDNLGRRTQHRVGVGFPDVEAADASWEYDLNGQATAVIDGNGNRAELRYDGHMRQDRWTFPSPTGPPGTVNADYEEYGYDRAGNRVTHRRRDGSTLSFQYDSLNRLIRKTVPERAGLSYTHTRDVFYGYDLRNLPLYARFDGHSGEGVTNAYDPFGRQVSSSINLGGTTRTLTYTWDEAGNRRELRHPDHSASTPRMFETNYEPALGRPSTIGENGAAWGPGLLAAFGYDGFGRPLYLARASGATTYLATDQLRRLTAIGHDLQGGSANDLALEFAYNPASGLSSTTRSNDAYAWTGHYAVSRAYSTNGLNQYTNAGGAGFTYDQNGNLITTPGPIGAETLTYAYDSENRLVLRTSNGASSTVTLVYDPLGRLFSVMANGATTTFLYDGDALVAEYNGATLLRRYVHAVGADVPLVWYEGSGLADRRWLHADHQGSIIAISGGSGTVTHINAYHEYGIPASANIGRFQYTGQIYLAELGLYHYKARAYSPTLGRFLQTDPVGYDDQFNLYAYVGNDPVNRTDPNGTHTCAGTAAQCRAYSAALDLAERSAREGDMSASEQREVLRVIQNIRANRDYIILFRPQREIDAVLQGRGFAYANRTARRGIIYTVLPDDFPALYDSYQRLGHNPPAERAGVVGHEGGHHEDFRRGAVHEGIGSLVIPKQRERPIEFKERLLERLRGYALAHVYAPESYISKLGDCPHVSVGRVRQFERNVDFKGQLLPSAARLAEAHI